jgi:hypothetical protein
MPSGRELVLRGIVAFISAATVWRTLREDAVRPWSHRSWIFPRDPDFATKAARVLDLYARCFEGQPLGDNELVISADEKTSIQARCRCHPTLPPGKSRLMRVDHEYDRGGALAYLAAYDVHRATSSSSWRSPSSSPPSSSATTPFPSPSTGSSPGTTWTAS